MTESVEQAALRRAARNFATGVTGEPAPPTFEERVVTLFEKCVHGLASLNLLDDKRAEQIAELHAENAEIRDAVLALSNRIEAVHRQTRHVMLRPEDAA